MGDYLTAEEIAAKLRLHPQTIRTWCRTGDMEAEKVGKQWRITHAAYDAFMEKARTQGHGLRKAALARQG